MLSRGNGKRRALARIPEEPSALLVGEVRTDLGDHSAVVLPDGANRSRFGLHEQVPQRGFLEPLEQVGRVTLEHGTDMGIELSTGSSRGHVERRLHATGAPVELDHRRELDDPDRQRDVFTARPCRILAIPACIKVGQKSCHVRRYRQAPS